MSIGGFVRSSSFERVGLVYVQFTDLERSNWVHNLRFHFPNGYAVWNDTCWAANGHWIEKSNEPSIEELFVFFSHHTG